MMLRIKKIDGLVFVSFFAPYVLSFLIALFVLVMQFLWKYIDDITGKGISFFEVMELVFYFALTIIPLAIPISILLSSVFVFGNMAEKFELTSMKSSGVSLIRIFRSGIWLAVMTALFSILASNVIVPRANKKFFARFDAIRKLKPALTIEEGLFNDDFRGYKIYVQKKHKDEKTVEGVLIYDETSYHYDLINVISARTGVMQTSADGRYFIMNLFDGEQIRELQEKPESATEDRDKYPLTRTHFEKWQKIFDMSEFDLDNVTVNLNRRKYDLLNTIQLLRSIDTVENSAKTTAKSAIYSYNDILNFGNQSTEAPKPNQSNELKPVGNVSPTTPRVVPNRIHPLQLENLDFKKVDNLFETFAETEKNDLSLTAHSRVQKAYVYSSDIFRQVTELGLLKSRFVLKLNQQYSWAFICIIFLFIGGPMGSIIRKGGYGYPLLFAILFFMLFIILRIMGEKLWRSQSMDAVTAAWLPCLVLTPVAIFLTYKALIDSKMFTLNHRMRGLKWWRGIPAKKA